VSPTPPDPSDMTANYLRMFGITPADLSETTRVSQSELEARKRELRPDWQNAEWIRAHRRVKWSDYYYGEQFPASALQEQIDAAVAAGSSEVTIKPGMYIAPKLEEDAVMITIEGVKDLVINAKDVFLIGQGSNRFINIFNCENLTLNDLVMDLTSDGLHYTQGTIIAASDDGDWVDVQIHDGYPMPDLRRNRAYKVEHYDSRTLLLADDSPTFYRIPYTVNGRVLRMSIEHEGGALPVGDYITMIRTLLTPHGIFIEHCKNLTLRGVKLHAAPMFAILDDSSVNSHYDSIEITPGPIFDQATLPRLKSGSQDGIHIGDMRGDGALIENSIIECHSDDGIAINSGYSMVVRKEGNAYYLTCKHAKFNIEAGDEVYQTRIRDMRRMGTAEALSVTEVLDPALIKELQAEMSALVRRHGIRRSGLRHGQFWRLEMSEPIEVDGDQFFSRKWGNYGVTIRDNFIANHRARSLLLKTSGALVENNVIFHGQNTPLVMSTERFWTEGDYSRDMVIRNNAFIDCGYGWMHESGDNPKTSGLFTIIGESGVPSHDNLVFENNRLEVCHRMPIQLSAASNVRIENNQFNYLGFRELTDGQGQPHIMRVEDVDSLTYRGNQVGKVGSFYGDDPINIVSGTNLEIE